MSRGGERTEAWPTVALGDVAEMCLGKMLDAQKNKGRPQPYLRNPNVRWFDVDLSDVQTMPFEEREDERYGLRTGDVLICEGGEAGRAAIWDGQVLCMKFQKAIHRVRCGPRLNNRFLVHRLMADYFSGRLADYYTGATIKHLTGQDLARYRFALPSLPEQRRIAEILDRADALRAKRRAALAQLDTLTQSIFLDMFGDPATNPKDVRQVALGDVADIATGSTPSREVDGYFGGDVPWVKTTEVRGEVISNTEETLTESGLRAIRGKLHPINSVVLAMYGQGKTRGQSGLLAIEAAVNQACAVVRPSPSFDARFMFAQLRASYERLRALARGGNQENLNLELVRSFRVLLPPLRQQAEFVERVGAVGRVAALAKNSFSELDDLFASLQHRAFRGEL